MYKFYIVKFNFLISLVISVWRYFIGSILFEGLGGVLVDIFMVMCLFEKNIMLFWVFVSLGNGGDF